MADRYLRLLAAVLVAGQVWCLPSGCRHNGTSYGEGEVVRAGEPCLSCVCRRGALGCSLRVCADHLESLPAGCFLVHRAEECCPQLYCEGGLSPKGIEVRAARTEGRVGCVINGTTYGEGSAVGSGDPCEYCYCAEGGLRCVKPRCVEAFEGCRAVYERSSCCPTHFDCRDAKVSFFTSRVNLFGELTSKDPLRALTDDEADRFDESSTESTTEDSTAVTTEETSEGTTLEAQQETTTASSDSPTTLSFQTSSDGTPGESAAAATEETTPEVTSQAPVTEVEGRKPATEAVEHRWNSSEIADDYDSYDYGEPKLPPSLPNLVIFPFVAADAVVKDDRGDLHEEVQVDRIDDQPVVFKDYFSPPTRTEGGFVPKQPSPEPFYEIPFLRKEPTEPPSEERQTALQINAPPEAPKEDASFDDHLSSGSDSKGPLNEVLLTEKVPDYFLKDVPDRKSQQTKKPVTVTYKNVVVDFYPDYLVTTTRTHPTVGDATGEAQQPNTSPSVHVPVDPVFGFLDKATVLPTAELPAEATTAQAIPTSTRESSFFEQFLKTFLTEANTSTALTPSKHKYSSKIKSAVTTTAKPDRPSVPQAPPTDLQFSGSSGFGDLQQENKLSASAPDRIHPNPATLLKLAGCNIYGMMYRIGKVITELSGPCVECLCTDLGVQCNPLQC